MWCVKVVCLCGILAFAVLVVLAAGYGHHVLFRPSKTIFGIPSGKFTDFSKNGITGRWINTHQGRTILHCHGNNDNLTERKKMIDIAEKYSMNLLLFDYQGFGKSSGTPYQYSLQPDSQTAYDFLISQGVDPGDIVIWGESLGGSPAVHLASKNPCAGLVLMAAYSSIEDALGDYDGAMWKICQKMYKYVFDPSTTTDKLKNVKVPVLIVHSTEDEMIPFKGGQRLFDSVCHKAKKLIKIKGLHGNPIFDENIMDKYMKLLATGNLAEIGL